MNAKPPPARALFAICAALLLASCAFTSESPFFTVADAAYPFADGARLIWREQPSGEEEAVITFAREGGAYAIHSDAEDEPMRDVLVVPIAETAEEDYIVQIRQEGAAMYAFLWRTREGYRLFADPGEFSMEEAGARRLARYCALAQYHECRFGSSASLRRLYRALVWKRFVRGAEAPGSYIELLPMSAVETP